jgi:hypothetical protein
MKKAVVAFVIALAMGLGQAATVATASSNIDGEEIRAFDFGFSGAPEGDREAGPYSVVFTNTDPTGFHVILFARISSANQRASKAQIIHQLDLAGEILMRHGNPICPTCFFDQIAGGAFAPPGATTPSFGPDLRTPGPVLLLGGRYVYFCPVTEPDGSIHYKLGMFGTFWAK